MIHEPIIFTKDDNGAYHFKDESWPSRTVIDIHSLAFRWIKVSNDCIIIELDGRSVIYDCVGVTPQGHWVCEVRVKDRE